MSDLSAEEDSVWWSVLMISLLIILVETAPIVSKLIMPAGPYDIALARQELLQMAEELHYRNGIAETISAAVEFLHLKKSIMKRYLHFILLLTLALPADSVNAQTNADEQEIIKAMNAAADKWNQGDLDGYMALYDPAATMMMPQGREGIKGMRSLYEKYYFENGKPKQQLAYDTYQFTPLGKNYGLLTGRFILRANEKMKERTGTFSLVMVRHGKEWKILHDHSG